ncbi:hypothetical protein LCGC14_1257000 [marine sediment metagenome]|uniref:Uncharacterized protein n=1 Tax=marine sediment metagenome TaxID=412755 RepID=A0A0F9L4M5_9ZZZZ
MKKKNPLGNWASRMREKTHRDRSKYRRGSVHFPGTFCCAACGTPFEPPFGVHECYTPEPIHDEFGDLA